MHQVYQYLFAVDFVIFISFFLTTTCDSYGNLWKMSEVNAKCSEYITLLPVVNELIVLMSRVPEDKVEYDH